MMGRDVFAAAAGRRYRGVAACALALLAFLGIGASSALAAPTVSIDPPGTTTMVTAQVSGHVTTEAGVSETSYFFQYAIEGTNHCPGEAPSCDPSEENENWESGGSGGPIAESTSEAVSATLTGLKAENEYEVRLGAYPNTDFVSKFSAVELFKTDAVENVPALDTEPVSAPGYLKAHLVATLDPEGGNVDPVAGLLSIPWEIQYSANPGDAEPTWETAAGGEISNQEPEGGGTPPAETSSPITLEADAGGLIPGHEYAFRLKAVNAGEPILSAPRSFETKAVAKPTIEPGLIVSDLTTTTAHLTGAIDTNSPEAAPVGDPEVEEAFATEWRFECTPSCVGLVGGTLPADEAAATVENDATNLQPNVEYTVTLIATNKGGTSELTEPFKPGAAPPAVKAFAAGPVQATQAGINGQVNPHNSPTTYWFEWGTADCSANPCQSIPASEDADAGSDGFNHYVLRQLTGLSPETTYHFRLVAKNAAGTTEGPDEEFTTASVAEESPECDNAEYPGAGRLPDCRAWEMVSPPDKIGSDVVVDTSKVRVAVSGDAVTFNSLGGFADPQGGALDVEYISRRSGAAGTNGWTSHAISPRQPSLTIGAVAFGQISRYTQVFTPDLSRGVFRSWLPLTDAPNVANLTNLYRRSNLLTGSGTTELLSDAFAPVPPSPSDHLLYRPSVADASADLSHVIFESSQNLTADAIGGATKLYENANGAVRLVGRIPTAPATSCEDAGGSACTPAPRSRAGLGAGDSYTSGMISRDGSRVFFVAGGNAYMRVGGTRTVQLNASQKSEPESPRPVELWVVSGNASRAFFITSEGLVEGDDGNPDLYMYDVDAAPGHHLRLLSIDGEPGDGHFVSAVIGSSVDGEYVYFVSTGQLVPGEPLDPIAGIYLWHSGQVTYVGGLRESSETRGNSPAAGGSSQGGTNAGRVSPDGRYLLFMTHDPARFVGRGGFGGYDHGGGCTVDGTSQECREEYLYDADTGRLVCATCHPDGTAARDDAISSARDGSGATQPTFYLSKALSDDGRFVFFNTGDALLADDTNGKVDAYEYDSQTGNVRLISSGTGAANSYFLGASDDGRDVFFATRQRLVGWDVDDNYDLYDARVNGGFADPVVPLPECTGEQCQGTPALPSAAQSFGSSLFATGGANPGPGSKLKRALRACRSKPSKAKRKKCEATARRRFGKSGGSK